MARGVPLAANRRPPPWRQTVRWVAFAACVALVAVAQTALSASLAIGHVKPDWPFVLVVFFALYARRRDAIIAAWVLGAVVDILSLDRLGVMMFAFTLVALPVTAIREYVFLRTALTHGLVTLVAGLILGALLGVYRVLVFPHAVVGWTTFGAELIVTALYTAVWAVPIHWALLGFSRTLGLRRAFETGARFSATGPHRV